MTDSDMVTNAAADAYDSVMFWLSAVYGKDIKYVGSDVSAYFAEEELIRLYGDNVETLDNGAYQIVLSETDTPTRIWGHLADNNPATAEIQVMRDGVWFVAMPNNGNLLSFARLFYYGD